MTVKRILFVDDDESQRDVMQRVLKKLGYEVTLADSTLGALAILENHHFPLIITDLSMPGLDGIALCKRIRQTNSESIVYALSGYIESYEVEKLEAVGFDGFLRKPTTSQMLKQAIEGAFDKLKRSNGADADISIN